MSVFMRPKLLVIMRENTGACDVRACESTDPTKEDKRAQLRYAKALFKTSPTGRLMMSCLQDADTSHRRVTPLTNVCWSKLII